MENQGSGYVYMGRLSEQGVGRSTGNWYRLSRRDSSEKTCPLGSTVTDNVVRENTEGQALHNEEHK